MIPVRYAETSGPQRQVTQKGDELIYNNDYGSQTGPQQTVQPILASSKPARSRARDVPVERKLKKKGRTLQWVTQQLGIGLWPDSFSPCGRRE